VPAGTNEGPIVPFHLILAAKSLRRWRLVSSPINPCSFTDRRVDPLANRWKWRLSYWQVDESQTTHVRPKFKKINLGSESHMIRVTPPARFLVVSTLYIILKDDRNYGHPKPTCRE
jgi:hypothetical protein